MKKICISFVCLVSFVLILPTFSYAEKSNEMETEVGFELERIDSKNKGEIKPTLIDGGNTQLNYQLLPKTGELLTSLIITLLGISLLIFFLGLMTIKQFYQVSRLEI